MVKLLKLLNLHKLLLMLKMQGLGGQGGLGGVGGWGGWGCFQEKANCLEILLLNLTHLMTMPQAACKNIKKMMLFLEYKSEYQNWLMQTSLC